MNTSDVDAYLRDGCGRCELYRTAACKVHGWAPVLKALRALVRKSGLVEELKWGSPCYTLDGKNVVMIAAFKEACVLQFFKGAALVDDEGVLERAGPNSQVGRRMTFRSAADVKTRRDSVARLIDQAMRLERSGTGAAREVEPEPVPTELARRLAGDAALREAFERLTPGRRRSHVLHIGGAKQSATRERRVDACAPLILAGRGFHER